MRILVPELSTRSIFQPRAKVPLALIRRISSLIGVTPFLRFILFPSLRNTWNKSSFDGATMYPSLRVVLRKKLPCSVARFFPLSFAAFCIRSKAWVSPEGSKRITHRLQFLVDLRRFGGNRVHPHQRVVIGIASAERQLPKDEVLVPSKIPC